MTTTTFSVGQDVWFMFDSKPLCGRLMRVGDAVSVKVKHKGKFYLFSRAAKDFHLYASKEELLKNIDK